MTDPFARAARFSPVYLDENAPLRRQPYSPELPRPQRFYDQFEDRALFFDVFRSAGGRHVYLVGPIAMNLEPAIRGIAITGLASGHKPRVQLHFGLQVVLARVRLPREDTHLRVEIAGQSHEVEIRPNASELFAGERVLVAINKDNALQWIADWARFYVKEHGATAVIVYDNGSTAYSHDELRETIAGVAGVRRVMVVPWSFRYGMTDPHHSPQLPGHWVRFAQPPLFTQVFRKYAARSRSLLSVDIDELVVSPHRRSVFKAAERSPFGILRFTRIWVENVREDQSSVPRHADFIVRKKGRRAKDPGKKWAINPRRAWLGLWRAQPWTHQVRGWLNLSGSSADFYAYHLDGITTNWGRDRTATPVFDPKVHVKDRLLIDVFADVFGTPRKR